MRSVCCRYMEGGRAIGFIVGVAIPEVIALLQADVGERMSKSFGVALIGIFEKFVVERAHGLWDGFGLDPEHHADFA